MSCGILYSNMNKNLLAKFGITQEIISKGEIFHLQNVTSTGPLSVIRNDFEGYIRDFKIALQIGDYLYDFWRYHL